ncbi:MAG: DNA-3-methyladenine glycosylase I [bacterium]|nr:DNA-3-methyladenine glycosylase I [bacterium]
MRCDWAETSDEMREYHDTEWGTPQKNDLILFEYILLDSFQAGLSWATILHKRKSFQKAFSNFDPKRIAKYGTKEITALVNNKDIVRHKGKIEATIGNAKIFLAIQKEYGSFSSYLWRWVSGTPVQSKWRKQEEVPTNTKLSDAISKDLKARGFRFFGSTICYAFLQGSGVVNDHVTTCFRYASLPQKGIAKI